MLHPLAQDLSSLTTDELNAKYNELNKKYILASRSGSGQVLAQMQMLLEGYREELGRRHQRMLDDVANKNSNFKNIIDIK